MGGRSGKQGMVTQLRHVPEQYDLVHCMSIYATVIQIPNKWREFMKLGYMLLCSLVLPFCRRQSLVGPTNTQRLFVALF